MKSVTLECDALNPNAVKSGHKKKHKNGPTQNSVINNNGNNANNDSFNNNNSPDSGSFDLASLMNDPTSDFYQSQVAALNYFKPEARQLPDDQWKTVKSKGSRKHSQSSDLDSLPENGYSVHNMHSMTGSNNKKASKKKPVEKEVETVLPEVNV